MVVCVVGARGMLGTDLCAALGPDRAVALIRAEADITDGAAVRAAIERIRPTAVVNCAAYTKVDDCETNRDPAFAVNGAGAGNVAAAAAAVDATLIQVSTDYVFEGSATTPVPEDAPVNPLSVYGASKLAGEEAVRAAHPSPLIVRTAWLYGTHGPNFVETILRLAHERDRLTVVNDQYGAPTFTRDLAAALVTLIEAQATGALHVTNAGSCTWHEFARFLVAEAGITGVEVAPISTAEFGRPAPRPAYSVLDCARFAQIAGAPMRPWQDAARDYLSIRAATAERDA